MTVFDVLHPKSSYIPSVRRFCGRKGIGSVKKHRANNCQRFLLEIPMRGIRPEEV